jgi:outer membrane protein insertion porin family
MSPSSWNKLAAALIALCLPLSAQQKKRAPAPAPKPAPEAPQVFPLEILKIQGNRRIPSEKIAALTGLKIGGPVVKADFDAARDRLLATGAFESVACEYKPSAANTGYEGIFEVVEVELIYPYRFEELPVADDVLRAALRRQEPLLDDEVPARKELLDRYARVVQQTAGGGGLNVIGRLSMDIPEHPAIIFRPDKPQDNVIEVHFTGNEVLPAALLMRTIAGVAIGTLYSETTMRLLLDSSIRPLYDARGRIRVAFPKITSERAKLIDGVIVTVAVDEGPSYNLNAVKFTGVNSTEAAEMQRTAKIQTGDIANFDEVQAGMDRLYQRYRNLGYLRVSGHLDRKIDDQAHTVDVLASIDPGPQFVMGKLDIKGLDLLSEPPVRKVWSLKQGAPFQPGYPDAFLEDLRQQGVFDNLGKTRAETKIDESTHVIDVTLYFAGAPTEQQRTRKQ